MQEIASSRKSLLLLLFRILHLHRHLTSCRHDVPNQQTQRSNWFVMEAAKTMGWKLATMVRGGACLLPNLPSKNRLTTTQQRLSTRRDIIGRQRPPWCPTPVDAAYNSQPACWLIVACGGAGSGAPWRLWDDGGCHDQRGMV